MASTSPPTMGLGGGEPVALIGAAITLPAKIHNRDKFFEIIRKKNQVSVDTVAAKRYHATDIDDISEGGHPWKLKSKYAMVFTEEELASYDCHFFNIQGKVAKNMHIQQLGVLQSVFEGLEDAGIPLHDIYRTRTGVFVAAYTAFLPAADAPDESLLRGQIMSSLADQVSYFLGTYGPSITMETACSSSLVAIAMAVSSLQQGDCDTAVVCGLNYLNEKDFHLSLQACGVMVQGPTSHPFDEEGAKGYIRCEGAGTIVLRRRADAERQGNRILCNVLRAIAASAGPADNAVEGPGRVYEQPCPYGMREMFSRVYKVAGVPLSRLHYMECHATGTAVGDVIELQAIGDVFGDSHDLRTRPLRIASVKSNIGHAEVAAGVLSVIKIVEMMRHRVFLPSAGVSIQRKDFEWDRYNMVVQQEEEPFPDDEAVVVGVNSFGIGGAYGHVVLEEYKGSALARAQQRSALLLADEEAAEQQHSTGYLLPLSAASQAHLQLYAERLAAYLKEQQERPPSFLRDACGTMWVNRSRFQFRKTFVASTVPELAAKVDAFAKAATTEPCGEGRKMQVAYVFTGQGAQWPGVGQSLLAFPVYRKAVTAVDRRFKALAGWSILDKSKSLSADEMKETLYAQPISFLVQVGLYELLKFFRVFPDVVIGHSAGEVAAAYAAGLLTLEEAVEVVFHRSAEQAKLAGCGRLLAVAMSEAKVRELIADMPDVEVACVNSPESVVLASSEARLKEVEARLGEAVSKTFVPGNIAFHSSRTTPCLAPMRARLAPLLDKRPRTWALPFISSVTGKVETHVGADYWCSNVRQPVLFQAALETAFGQDTHPDVVLEIGPHKTLCSPILQCLSAMGKSATVLPTLKKGDVCAHRFLEALGLAFERGVIVDAKPWFEGQLGYRLDEALPRHPYIFKRMHELHPVLKRDMRNGLYHLGPVAGIQKFFDGAFVVEASDRTYKQMCDHKMGGSAIFPGMFFVEMVIEALKGAPCTLTNVDFKSMLKIPAASAGESPVLLALTFQDEPMEDLRGFVVRSVPSREKWDEEPVLVEHCTGKVTAKHDHLLNDDGSIKQGFKPEAFGLLGDVKLQDVGEAGLKELIARHTTLEHGSTENFYGTHCVEGQMEYLSSFQLVETVHTDPKARSILGKLRIDQSEWEAHGGTYSVQLLDAVLHQTLVLATHTATLNAIYYAGGFDAAHFLRKPSTPDIYVHFTLDKYSLQIGRKKKIGDFAVYDGHGQLIFFIQGFFTVFASASDAYKLCDLLWQPFEASKALPEEEAEGEEAAALLQSVEPWQSSDNARLSCWLAHELQAQGALQDPPAVADNKQQQAGSSSKASKARGPDSEPLYKRVRDAIASRAPELQHQRQQAGGGEVPAFPKASKLGERGPALLQALVDKLKPAEQKAGEAVEAPLKLEAEQLRECVSAATFQPQEAALAAGKLRALAMANQAALNHNYVLRVLEVAQDGLVVETVAEALSRLDLPAAITVEFFVGSHNAGLLKSLGSRVSRKATNFRLRRVLLSELSFNELKDLTFEALVLDDWTRSGAATYAEGAHYSPAVNALASLGSFLMPGAHVFVRGLAPLPLWVSLASQLAPSALPLSPSQPAQAAASEWAAAFNNHCSSSSSSCLRTLVLDSGASSSSEEGAIMLQGRYSGPPAQAGRFVLVADDSAQAQQLSALLKQASHTDSVVDVLGLGQAAAPGSALADDGSASADDFAAALKDLLGKGLLADQDGGEGSSSKVEGPAFRGLVFTAGLSDSSVIGEVGFARLLKLAQGLQKNGDLLKSLKANDLAERAPLWVVTQGAYVSEDGGELRPNQGTLQGMTTVLCSELHDVISKHVDLAALPSGLPALARLVAADAREKSYAVRPDGQVVVARFNAVDKHEARCLQVKATDRLCYFADLAGGLTVPGEMAVAFKLQDLPPPKDDEVQVDIYAAALNFRDVMIALSLLPEKSYERSYYGRNLGLEASGVVTAVGKNVKDLQVGDRVMTGEPRCFANRLNAPAYRVVKLDHSVSFEDAASLQSVYNTSHHALINLARIKRGDKVLIHSAAGGIGHAAISICQHVGATIYATAGSDEKRELVRAMGVSHVYTSRSTAWFDALMADTDGQGVDVVLNSLAGKHQRLGVQALRSSGRFLEIGKMDIFDNNGLGLLAFRKNISFFAIDMDRLALDDPQATADIGRAVGRHFMEGHYHKLPIVSFPMGRMRDALEFMKTGKHVGKVVLTNYETDGQALCVTVEKPQDIFHADCTYLITGGAGGFGSKLLRYAYYHGARHFLITTRASDTAKTREAFRDVLDDGEQAKGLTIEVMTVDTAKEDDVARLCRRAHQMDPPVRAVFHVAGVSVDVVLPEMKPESLFEVADCKARGAWFLHQHSLSLPLDHFVCVSSIASLIGGLGMSSYSSANAFLDALMRYRRARGLPGAAFNMSSLSDVGILANNLQARKFQLKMGVEYMTSFRALQELEAGLMTGQNPIITMFFKEKTRTMFPFQAPWSHHLQEVITLGAVSGGSGFMTAKEIAAFLADEIKDITGAAEVLVTQQLVTLGLDSFGFVELGGRIKKHFGIEVNSVKMTPDNTLEDVSKIIYKLQSRGGGDGKKGGEAGAVGGAGEELSVLHNKAEMNSMLSSLFEDGEALVAPAGLKLASASSASSLKRSLTMAASGGGAGPYERVLLFGATGLTGAHLLRYLIKAGGASKVYCVVRSSTSEGGLARIEKALRLLKIWKDSFAQHIVALPGDMALPQFGLKKEDYELLARRKGGVQAIVHAGGSRKWHMDSESVQCNISGLMNVITLARKSHASVHYISSGWLDAEEAAEPQDQETLRTMPYVQIKRKAEDLLHFAARHYRVPCFAYRLPLISVNTRGGFSGDFIVFSVMQSLYETGMLPSEMGDSSSYPIMPADLAAKYTVRQMGRAALSTSSSKKLKKGKGSAVIYSASQFSEVVPTPQLADWVEALKGSRVNRAASMDEVKAYYHQKLIAEVRELQTGFVDFLAALGRASEQLRRKIRRSSSFRSLWDKSLYYQPKVAASSLLLDYIRDNPEVLLMNQAWFEDGEEDEVGEDEELKALGTPALATPIKTGTGKLLLVDDGNAFFPSPGDATGSSSSNGSTTQRDEQDDEDDDEEEDDDGGEALLQAAEQAVADIITIDSPYRRAAAPQQQQLLLHAEPQSAK